jgi:hypothetical protein
MTRAVGTATVPGFGSLCRRLLGPALAASLLTGCVTARPRTTYTAADLASAQVLSGAPVRFWANGADKDYSRWNQSLKAQRAATGASLPRTLLAISGGADKGALSAGLLNAWTKRGDRPKFDIVTGVSTGALIAPFAFLGPDQDASLKAIYTGVDSRDIFRKQLLKGVLGGPSLLDSSPLQRLIARHVTHEFIQRIAAEHRSGRRLLVSTTNLDADRGVIWDLGAIADSDDPRRLHLFRQVLLASASIPGGFPPVHIEASSNGRFFTELHVDGGVVGGFFILPRAMLANLPNGPEDAAIYLLYNARLARQLELVKPRTFAIMSKALNAALSEMDRIMVRELQAFADAKSIAFSLCAVENDFTHPPKPLFDRKYMNALYTYGERKGAEKGGCLSDMQHPEFSSEHNPPSTR